MNIVDKQPYNKLIQIISNKKHIRFDYLVDLTAGYEKLEFIEGV